jgi:hypothetical protein
MHSRDANDRLNVQRVSHPARPAEQEPTHQECRHFSSHEYTWQEKQHEQLLETPPSRMHPAISTERIMRAVEQQRRITQELDELCARQQERAVLLRKTSFKLAVGVSFSLGLLVLAFICLSLFQPDILVRLLGLLSDTIALVVAAGEGIRTTSALIPSNSWLLSGVALVIVLMMGLWLRLMRYPREV